MSNDTTATLLKFVTSLTSPKAAIKYIAVGFFLLFFLRFITAQVNELAMSPDYTFPITMFLGIGAGSLVGEVVYVLANFVWKLLLDKRLASAARKEESEKAASALLVKRDEEAAYLTRFKKAYAHFHSNKKWILRALTSGEKCLNRDSNDLYELESAYYIIQVVRVTGDNYIYKINATISDYVTEEWNTEVQDNTETFFSEMTAEKNELLKVMAADFLDEDTRLEGQFRPNAHPLEVCFDSGYKPGEGIWIDFKEKYSAAFTARTGVAYKDGIFIKFDA